jgi:HEAT repeat protein
LLHYRGRIVGYGTLALLLAIAGVRAASDDERLPKPVADFREALRKFPGLSDTDIEKRKEYLLREAKKLTSLVDKARALILIDWADQNPDTKLGAADREVRTTLMKSFTSEIKQIVRSGTTRQRLAVATLLTETVVNLRKQSTSTGLGNYPTATDQKQAAQLLQADRLKKEFVRTSFASLASDMAELTSAEHDDAVRATAALALGQIEPSLGGEGVLKVSIDALADLLRPGNGRELRRAAATALMQTMQVAADEQRRSLRSDVESIRPISLRVLPVVSRPLREQDNDVVVRRQCIDAWRYTSDALADLIPAPGTEATSTSALRKTAAEWRKDMKPILEIMQKFRDALATAVNDTDLPVRSNARRTAENLGKANRRLLDLESKQAESLPPPDDKKKKDVRRPSRESDVHLVRYEQEPDKPTADPLVDTLTTLRPALEKGLANPSNRLAAVEALEMMGELAAPTIPSLVRFGLSDNNIFVRWATARTLGELAIPMNSKENTRRAALVVPRLAEMLSERDLDMRLTVATAIRHYGADARAALPAVERMINRGDTDSRVGMLNTVSAIGAAAGPALPSVAAALRDNTALVRATAADTLGRYGPGAVRFVPDVLAQLRGLLNDSDSDVRLAASEAILRISGR